MFASLYSILVCVLEVIPNCNESITIELLAQAATEITWAISPGAHGDDKQSYVRAASRHVRAARILEPRAFQKARDLADLKFHLDPPAHRIGKVG